MGQRLIYGTMVVGIVATIILGDALLAITIGGDEGLADEGFLQGIVLAEPFEMLVRRGSLIPLAFCAALVFGAVEVIRMLRSVGVQPQTPVAIAGVAIVFLLPWLTGGELVGGGLVGVLGADWPLAVVGGLAVLSAVWQLGKPITPGAMSDVAGTWFVVLYLGFLPSFMLMIRCWSSGPSRVAVWLVLSVVAVVKVSDMGAFFVGSAMGRTKLIPRISPAKTVEGTIGGVLASVMVSIWMLCFPPGFVTGDYPSEFEAVGSGWLGRILDRTETTVLSIWQAALFGVAMAVVGQLGDLFESVLKRASASKDSGSVVPELGGILDMIDSPVLAAPVAWMLLSYWWAVV
jgi:phosphatidate cytidylyltransferase